LGVAIAAFPLNARRPSVRPPKNIRAIVLIGASVFSAGIARRDACYQELSHA
jgi:hypothetical protein